MNETQLDDLLRRVAATRRLAVGRAPICVATRKSRRSVKIIAVWRTAIRRRVAEFTPGKRVSGNFTGYWQRRQAA